MKREFLKELGLTDEQVDKVMAENGKDIEKYKSLSETQANTLTSKEKELDTIKAQLETANEQIEDFKEMDIDGIKKAADDYKEKLKEAQTTAKEELEKLQFEHQLDIALRESKAKNTVAVRALLDMEGLKLNDNEIIGLKDQIEKLQEEQSYLFEVEDTGEGSAGGVIFSRPGGNPKPGAITSEDFKKMSYREKRDLYNKDRELYRSLTK